MKAVVIDGFGGPEKLSVREVPRPDPGEVRIRVAYAGIGDWDVYEREGGFAGMFGREARFPHLLGSEASGIVDAVGPGVGEPRVGDRVYAYSFLAPKGGPLAEEAVVEARATAPVPRGMSLEQAGGFPIIGVTTLRGLDDTLALQKGESLLVLGASGGLGHVAVQLARRMGARVLAVASGPDGVELVRRLGADAAVDGRSEDVRAAARAFAPGGLDAALLLAGGPAAEQAVACVRQGGRIAAPNGVDPVPEAPEGVRLTMYDGIPDPEVLGRLNRLVEAGPFEVHVGALFEPAEVAEAQRAVEKHHLGKVVVRVRPEA
jgi:NADPH2:quinone reductase